MCVRQASVVRVCARSVCARTPSAHRPQAAESGFLLQACPGPGRARLCPFVMQEGREPGRPLEMAPLWLRAPAQSRKRLERAHRRWRGSPCSALLGWRPFLPWPPHSTPRLPRPLAVPFLAEPQAHLPERLLHQHPPPGPGSQGSSPPSLTSEVPQRASPLAVSLQSPNLAVMLGRVRWAPAPWRPCGPAAHPSTHFCELQLHLCKVLAPRWEGRPLQPGRSWQRQHRASS